MSLDHEWFVEIDTTERQVIQMSCHLPANGKQIVHGSFERSYYGRFQSQRLFQWYQQYSHRWLGEKEEDEEISIELSP